MSPRAGLDRAVVARAAAELADGAGLEGVTLAGLADRLGVRTPSLYNHGAGLPGLRRELALLARRELAAALAGAIAANPGDAALVALADAHRAYARAHPGRYAATVAAPDPDDAELVAASEALLALFLAALAGHGLVGDDAVHAVRGLRALVHGFVTLETAGGFGFPLDRDESFRRLLATFAAGLRR